MDPSLASEVINTLTVGSVANNGDLRQEGDDDTKADRDSGSGPSDRWRISAALPRYP